MRICRGADNTHGERERERERGRREREKAPTTTAKQTLSLATYRARTTKKNREYSRVSRRAFSLCHLQALLLLQRTKVALNFPSRGAAGKVQKPLKVLGHFLASLASAAGLVCQGLALSSRPPFIHRTTSLGCSFMVCKHSADLSKRELANCLLQKPFPSRDERTKATDA